MIFTSISETILGRFQSLKWELISSLLMHKALNFISACSLFMVLFSCTGEKAALIPSGLSGQFSGNQPATVRFKRGFGDYVFIRSASPVACNVHIGEDGQVDGELGSASFDHCRVVQNRGFIGKMLHLSTDFKITGHLRGNIFPGDTISLREIVVPFTQSGDSLNGSIFHRIDASLFPISGFELRRSAPVQ